MTTKFFKNLDLNFHQNLGIRKADGCGTFYKTKQIDHSAHWARLSDDWFMIILNLTYLFSKKRNLLLKKTQDYLKCWLGLSSSVLGQKTENSHAHNIFSVLTIEDFDLKTKLQNLVCAHANFLFFDIINAKNGGVYSNFICSVIWPHL